MQVVKHARKLASARAEFKQLETERAQLLQEDEVFFLLIQLCMLYSSTAVCKYAQVSSATLSLILLLVIVMHEGLAKHPGASSAKGG